MTIEDAIKEAVKGGYKRIVKNSWPYGHEMGLTQMRRQYRVILLDIRFWQALGKARGWADDTFPRRDCGRVFCGKPCSLLQKCSGCGKGYGNYKRKENWIYHMHSLIDHLASGGTVEGFFANLK